MLARIIERYTEKLEETHTRTHTHRHHPPFTCGIQAQTSDLHRLSLRVTHPTKGFCCFFLFFFIFTSRKQSFVQFMAALPQ